MLATLDDPFTHFPEPNKFKSLRSGIQGALTSVGLLIEYPIGFDGSPARLLVILVALGGPTSRVDILYKVIPMSLTTFLFLLSLRNKIDLKQIGWLEIGSELC